MKVTAKKIADEVRATQKTNWPGTHLALIRDAEVIQTFTPDEFEREFEMVQMERVL